MRQVTIACAALLFFQACGGGSSPTAPSAPATPAPPTAPALPAPPANATTLYTATFTTAALAGARGTFDVPGAGTLTASVTWDMAGATIGAALTSDACSDVNGALAGTCANLGSPDLTAARPKTLTANAASALTAVIWIGNSSGVATSGTVRVSFTPAPVASPTPTPPPAPRPTPTPAPSYTCNGNAIGAAGQCAGGGAATALCRDRTFSCSQNRTGTCSSHNGVECWICPGPLC